MKSSIVLSFLLLINIFAAENKKLTLQLNWLNQFQFAGYYMAKELGYYKDIGVELKIKEYYPDLHIADAVLRGNVDFGVGRSSLVIDKSEGKDIVALAAIFQYSPLMLLVRKDSHINTIEDFRGKNIMITKDARNSASIMAMLSSKGIKKGDIHLKNHSFDLNDLILGKTDAMASYISNEAVLLEEKNIPYRMFRPKDYGFDFYSDILFTSSEFIKKNPVLTKEFLNASLKGWRYAFNNISKTAEIIYKKYNTQDKSLITLIKEGESLKKLIYHKHNIDETIGCLDHSKVQKIVDIYRVMGLVKSEDFDTNDFIYRGNPHKLFKFEFNYHDILLMVLLGLTFIVLLISSVMFVIIRKKWLVTRMQLESDLEEKTKEIEKKNKIILTQSKVAAVGEMLHNVAHQWRQPLSVISMSAAGVQASLEFDTQIDIKEVNKMVDNIDEQCKYLSRIIDDFSEYFVYQHDCKNCPPFDIKDTLLKIDSMVKNSFENLGIKIVYDLCSCKVPLNENIFIQSIMNIYNNVRDVMEIRKIDKKRRYFFVSLKCSDTTAQMILRDSGGGVEGVMIEKLFEPYTTTKHQAQGVGLGLYMTYEIVDKYLDGKVEVQNIEYEYKGRELKGAEFKITLPIS